MKHDELCANCGKGYKESESILKKSYKKNIGRKDWCDDCITNSDLDE